MRFPGKLIAAALLPVLAVTAALAQDRPAGYPLRPIRIINPEGSFLNAKFPAATTFGNSITGPTSDAIFRAFSKALPERVTAGWNRFLGCADRKSTRLNSSH